MEDITLTAKAEKFKNKGNDEFKLGNYQNAIEYFSQRSISVLPKPATKEKRDSKKFTNSSSKE